MANAKFKFNYLYEPVFTTKARYILLWGGRARGGSHFATDYFLFLMSQPEYFRGVIMRSIYGDIRGSLWQDWKDRLENSDFEAREFDIQDSRMSAMHKRTANSFLSKGFKKSSGSQSAKLKSLAGVTHIIIEEAEEVDEDDFNKLDDSIRTNKIENIQIILLFNPPSKNHWLMKRFFNLVESDVDGYYNALPKYNPDVLAIHSAYQDNIFNLNEKTIKKYEAYGDINSQFYNSERYFIDVKGLVPEGARGRIHRHFKPITKDFFYSLPYPSFYGLDFGYSDDPVALIELKFHNGRLFWHRIIYEPGLTNPMLAAKMTMLGVSRKLPIYADNAEPKSIRELRDMGFNVFPADKGPDSVLFGIKQIESVNNYATEESTEVWYELEEYKWALDRNREPTDKPIDKNDHAMNAGRYGFVTHLQLKRKGRISVSVPDADEKVNPLDW